LLGNDLGVLDAFLRSVQRLAESRLVDRLQQVVDCIHLERPYGILVVGCDERNQRHLVLLQHPHDADAVELRHLKVQQREVRSLLLDGRKRFLAGRRLRHDDDVFEGTKQRGEEGARWAFIVGDDYAEARVHEALRVETKGMVARYSAGILIRTVVPASGALSIDSAAASPY
jgi:hypothetical protein